jgi:hypothetical protein
MEDIWEAELELELADIVIVLSLGGVVAVVGPLGNQFYAKKIGGILEEINGYFLR